MPSDLLYQPCCCPALQKPELLTSPFRNISKVYGIFAAKREQTSGVLLCLYHLWKIFFNILFDYNFDASTEVGKNRHWSCYVRHSCVVNCYDHDYKLVILSNFKTCLLSVEMYQNIKISHIGTYRLRLLHYRGRLIFMAKMDLLINIPCS